MLNYLLAIASTSCISLSLDKPSGPNLLTGRRRNIPIQAKLLQGEDMKRVLLIVALVFPSLVNAELERVTFNCDGKTCFQSLPKLQPLVGWHFDRGPNNDIDATVLVPDGFTFETAEYIIYARALSKPLISDNPSLANFIAMEKVDFPELYTGASVTEVKPVTIATGQKLRSLVVIPKSIGKWEQITYTEEDGHFVVVTLSAKTEQAFKKALTAYYVVLGQYH